MSAEMGQPGGDGARRPATVALGVFVVACMVTRCGSSPIAPDAPPAASRVVVGGTSPGQGGAVVIPGEYVYNEIGGVILLPQSGLISVSLTMSKVWPVKPATAPSPG